MLVVLILVVTCLCSLLYCMLVAKALPIRARGSARPRSSRVAQFANQPAKQPPPDNALMLSKAVQQHALSNAPEKKSPDGSGKVQSHISSSQPTMNRLPKFQPPRRVTPESSNALQPLPPGKYNFSTQSQTSLNAGLKRTHSGLAKALGTSLPGAFDTPYLSNQDPVNLAKPPTTNISASDVVLNDDDFDSDPDLDFEEPLVKTSVAYPSLSQFKPPGAKSSPAPSQKASYHTQHSNNPGQPVSNDLPPSSAGLPWSSSPDAHKETPRRNGRQFLGQYTYNPQATSPTAQVSTNQPHTAGDVLEKRRPAKRRTLPWLQDGSLGEDLSVGSQQNDVASTPSSKTNPQYAWNTTASAIKDQQKELRKASREAKQQSQKAADEVIVQKISAHQLAQKKEGVARPHLSEEQKTVLDLVVESSRSVFFTGSAGTGKSVLLREIIAVMRKKYQRENDRIAITASTGLAACNIGGVTLHSFAGIGLGKEGVPELVKKIKKNQKAKHRWMRTKVLVIDEVSMVDGELFDKLEEIARQIRGNGRPFGGIQLVITGDFFQLPPVPEHGANARIAKFAFDAASWSAVINHTIALHHVFRQKDPVFASMLNEMREGRMTQESVSAFRSLSRTLDASEMVTELFPTRAEVEAANSSRMRQLDGCARTYDARDGGSITDPAQRSKLLQNCMAPQLLQLKKGSQVMLIKNMDESLVNGSLGEVLGFMNEELFSSYKADEKLFMNLPSIPDEDLNPKDLHTKRLLESHKTSTAQIWPLVRFRLADGTTRDLLCNRETWKVELPNGEVQASRAQVPLILAWALSIHKAQGQTLERVKVDLGRVFEKGQAYVALSRATSMAGLQVLRFDPTKVIAHERVRNFYAGLERAENAGQGSKPATGKPLGRRSTSKKTIPGGFDDDDEDLIGI